MGKKEVLDSTLSQIRKRYGEGSIMWLGEGALMDVETIPTGSLALDIALGVGGVPRGRIVEIFGPEASGKTTLALHMIAEAQRLAGTAAFIDAEHALDPSYTRAIGVDLDHLLLSQPNSGEQALEITEQLIRSGAIDIIVIDSVAALVPEAEIEGQMGDAQVGLQARLMSQAMRKLASAIPQSRTTVVFINQIRSLIGGSLWGPATTTSGGRALKFYASLRLDIRNIKILKEGDERVGTRTLVRVVKNKVAPPFKEAQFDIIYGVGISRERELVDLGKTLGIVNKNGSWYSYAGTQLGQGLTQSADFLREEPAVVDRIDREIREKIGLPIASEPADSQADNERAKPKQAAKSGSDSKSG
ncbi:MAG: recombinase RecA [Candidatus Bipolaricaulia bacterium]